MKISLALFFERLASAIKKVIIPSMSDSPMRGALNILVELGVTPTLFNIKLKNQIGLSLSALDWMELIGAFDRANALVDVDILCKAKDAYFEVNGQWDVLGFHFFKEDVDKILQTLQGANVEANTTQQSVESILEKLSSTSIANQTKD
jgi:hypothetical protein